MRRFLYVLFTLVLLSGSYTAWALNKSLPVLQPVSALDAELAPASVGLPWPKYGQAAVGAVGYGMLDSQGKQVAAPTASVAKILTSLSVLQKKPLTPGSSGPALTMGTADVNLYHSYVAKNGSVVPINYGEKISEYQALQAMLLPSANNMADSLAIWAFGSLPAYTDYANDLAKGLGLKQTHVADASGFSPATVSSASDLVLLGQAALANPVLKQIVSQKQASVPIAGTIHNVNRLLGQEGINGIKTGNTDEAGGVFLASADYTIEGRKVTIVTAVMGAPRLRQAMKDSIPLLIAASHNFTERIVVKAGDIVGYYNTPWHTSTNVVALGNLKSFAWKGSAPKLKLSLVPAHPPEATGTTAGTLTLEVGSGRKAQSIPVGLQQPLDSPSWKWRLLHP